MRRALLTQILVLIREPVHLLWTCILPTIAYMVVQSRYTWPGGGHGSIARALPYISYMAYNSACVGLPMAVKTASESGLFFSYAFNRVGRTRLIVSICSARLLVVTISTAVLLAVVAIVQPAPSVTEWVSVLVGAMLATVAVGIVFSPLAFTVRSATSLAVILQLLVFVGMGLSFIAYSAQFSPAVSRVIWLLNPMMWCTAFLHTMLYGPQPFTLLSLAVAGVAAVASGLFVAKSFRRILHATDA
jgi:ABC-type polysaccharide/polyol phosphate export permease